ncbi:MAG: hypothetical protein COT74_01645 [Bdellovibrionales bacterium CG10_big_fil_rev_8_21_14_0_10_45_34]|nr:MAG: hypothetical protein COT74_01645 [Bdellovibrionales bacterium CG10_big_fil_rev_8_21_14_0_10_45_34]
MDTKYNGWVNRETWACSLRLDNDFYDLKEVLKKSSKSWQDYSDKLRDLIYEMEQELKTNPSNELLDVFLDIGSLYRVDFDEIAKSDLN